VTPKLRSVLLHFALMMLMVMLQVSVAPLMSIGGIIPSFLLIGAVFVCLREGQMTGMLIVFPAGLLVDAYLSALVGITSLSLTIAVFAAGFFYDEEKTQLQLGSARSVLIVLMSALLYHGIYIFSYFQSLNIDILQLFVSHVLGSSLYTSVLSAIPVLVFARRTVKLKV
jgi:rod shape-determining protein MreD